MRIVFQAKNAQWAHRNPTGECDQLENPVLYTMRILHIAEVGVANVVAAFGSLMVDGGY